MNLNYYLDEYFKKFGRDYPIPFPCMLDDEELIEEIRACIERNKQAEEPEYEEGLIY